MTRRTLALKRETLAALTADDLAGIGGAALTGTGFNCTVLVNSGELFCVTRNASFCHSYDCTG